MADGGNSKPEYIFCFKGALTKRAPFGSHPGRTSVEHVDLVADLAIAQPPRTTGFRLL